MRRLWLAAIAPLVYLAASSAPADDLSRSLRTSERRPFGSSSAWEAELLDVTGSWWAETVLPRDARVVGYEDHARSMAGWLSLSSTTGSFFQALDLQIGQDELLGPSAGFGAAWTEASIALGRDGVLSPDDWLTVTPRWARDWSSDELGGYHEFGVRLEYARALTHRTTTRLEMGTARRRYANLFYTYEDGYDGEWFQQQDWLLSASATLTRLVGPARNRPFELRYDYERLRSNDPLQDGESHLLRLYTAW